MKQPTAQETAGCFIDRGGSIENEKNAKNTAAWFIRQTASMLCFCFDNNIALLKH